MRDIKHTIDGDVDITGGDISYTDSTAQHQKDLIYTNKGELKSNPSVGVGIYEFINDDDATELLTSIRTEFRKDGMKVNEVALVNGKVKTVAEYETN